MGKKQQEGSKKGVKRQRKHRVSSGKRRVWRARQELRRIKMKIERWKRNQGDEKKKKVWDKDQSPHLRSRHDNWNTAGLEKRTKQLESYIKRGPKRYLDTTRSSLFS